MEIIIFFCTNHIVSAQRIVFKGVKLLYRLLCPLRLLTPIDSIAHVFFLLCKILKLLVLEVLLGTFVKKIICQLSNE